MKTKTKRFIFFLYIGIFFGVSALLAWFQPLQDCPGFFNPPDEHARIKVVYYICDHLSLPTGFEEEIRIPNYGFSYALYNVFPYIVQGFVMRFAKLFGVYGRGLVFAARLVNVIFGTLMCFFVWKIGNLIFKKDIYAILFSFAVMYLPQSMFIHTYVNTDSAAMLSTAIIIYSLLLAYREDFSFRICILMGTGISLCALSYYNAYGAIACAMVVFFCFFAKKNKDKAYYDYKNMLKFGFTIAGVVLALSGWWFVRAYIVLDGDFLGLKTRMALQELYGVGIVPSLKEQGKSLIDLFKIPMYLVYQAKSFVMSFGSMTIFTSNVIYFLYFLLFLAGFVSVIFFTLFNRSVRKASFKDVSLHIGLFLAMIIPFVLSVRYSYTIDVQPQGRYLLPGLVPFMIFVIKGYELLMEFLKSKLKRAGALFGTVIPILTIAFFVLALFFATVGSMPYFLSVYPNFM